MDPFPATSFLYMKKLRTIKKRPSTQISIPIAELCKTKDEQDQEDSVVTTVTVLLNYAAALKGFYTAESWSRSPASLIHQITPPVMWAQVDTPYLLCIFTVVLNYLAALQGPYTAGRYELLKFPVFPLYLLYILYAYLAIPSFCYLVYILLFIPELPFTAWSYFLYAFFTLGAYQFGLIDRCARVDTGNGRLVRANAQDTPSWGVSRGRNRLLTISWTITERDETVRHNSVLIFRRKTIRVEGERLRKEVRVVVNRHDGHLN
ncbi:hypothetical protein TYRP_013976 [Tyrophagus putrescentiae]|nr:hypothetical protein TYRP_013976 [Tyrophagus putrescentiae]